ncbi:hypothetical protein [Nitratireductor alexandrii]|uniref:hypothetical protein n=1 Tax=Nitratireductor alexandrii TaxID=2448161 RepID=UPI000FD6FB24|nr:hypothetical protein [Nitratireductor alexandrii]
MTLHSTAACLFLSAALGLAALSGAAAAPLFAAAPSTPPGTAAAIPAGGCHQDTRRHFVPEFGKTLRHHHRRRDCRPVADETAERRRPADCHRAPRLHRVPGAGRIYHRHVGDDCRIRIIRRSSEPAIGN